MKCRSVAFLLAGLWAAPASAHHSFAMFDADKSTTLIGVVKEFQWTNPHVLIMVMVIDPKSQQPVMWTIENTSPGVLRRQGWNKDVLKPGDKVEVVGYPLRDGAPGAGFVSLKFTDTGKMLGVKIPVPPKE